MLQLFLGILMFSHATEGNYGCQPAEEGQPYQLSYTLTTIPAYRTMLLWLKDGQLVSECPVEAGECSNNDISWFHATVTRRENLLHFVLDVLNVTRETPKNVQGVWALKTHSLESTEEYLYSCDLRTYAKAVDVACVSNISTEGFTIACNTSRIFPEAMMAVHRNGHRLKVTPCENNKISENPVYYKAACIVIIPRENLHLEQNNFNISIYPNNKGYNNIENALAIKFVILHIEPKYVVQQTCENEANVVKCGCKRIDASDGVSKFDWYLNNSLIKQNSDVYIYTSGTEAEIYNRRANIYVESKLLSCCVQTAVHKNDKDSSVLNFFIVLIVILILTIVIMFFYTPKQCRIHFRKCFLFTQKTKTLSGNTPEEIPLRDKQQKNKESQVYIDVAIESVKEPKLDIDESKFEIKTTFLLLGTESGKKGGQKHNIRNLILQTKIKDAKSDVLRMQFEFSKLDNRLIKLADGPELNIKDISTFVTDLKHCIVAFPEGFNAILLALNENQDTNDIEKLIDVLVFFLGIEVMNHVIFINSSTNTSNDKMYKTFKDTYKGRILENLPENDLVSGIFALTDLWHYRFVCQSFQMIYDLGKLKSETLLENMLKMTSLLLQAYKETETGTLMNQSLKKQCVQVLKTLCEKYGKDNTEIGKEFEVILTFFEMQNQSSTLEKIQDIKALYEELESVYLRKVISLRIASLEQAFAWKVIDYKLTRDKNCDIPHLKYLPFR